MYEDTLLEKLNYILDSKSSIKDAIIDIGSSSINDETLLRDYPNKIKEIHSDILEVCKYLKFAVDGGELIDLDKDKLTTTDTLPYIQSILVSKDKLSTNLNAVGTSASNTESLDRLVDKVYTGSQALLEENSKLKNDKALLEFENSELRTSNKEMEATIRTLEDELNRINGENI